MPHQRVKKTRIKECGTKATTRKASKFGFGCLHVGRARASPEPNGVVFAGAGNELVGSPSEWILVKGKQKFKTVSTKTSSVFPLKQIVEKPVWIQSLPGKNVPHLRVKKTRTKESGTKATTRNASASKAKLASGKLSVFDENRSVPRKPACSGRAGKPFEGLGQKSTRKAPRSLHGNLSTSLSQS